MHIIKGPIKFEKGKEPPKKMKDWIKKHGIKVPFDPLEFTHIDRDFDDWVILRNHKNEKFKYTKKKKRFEKFVD